MHQHRLFLLFAWIKP